MTSQRSCDLCGWVIEEWQPVAHVPAYPPGDVTLEAELIAHPATWVTQHRNPADCKPTRKPDDVEQFRDLMTPESFEEYSKHAK